MSLFDRGYVFDMRMKYPDGTTETIRIAGKNFDDFASRAVMAGVRWGQAHPDLQPKEKGRTRNE